MHFIKTPSLVQLFFFPFQMHVFKDWIFQLHQLGFVFVSTPYLPRGDSARHVELLS